MTITWGDVQRWDPENLNSASRKLRELRQGLMAEADDTDGAKKRIRSTGAAVKAMKTSLGSLNANLDQLVNDISELMMATAAAAEGVWDVKTKVAECTSFAAEHTYLKIDAEGSVTYSIVSSGSSAFGKDPAEANRVASANASEDFDRYRKSEELKALIKAAIDRAGEVDDAYDKRLKAVGDGTYRSSETASSQSQGLPDLPQKGWSATEVAAWWNALTDDERKKIIEKHPEAIGNLDGISMAARDQANRRLIDGELESAQKHRAEVQRKYDDQQAKIDEEFEKHKGYTTYSSFSVKEVNPYADELKHADQKVRDLQKIHDLMGQKENGAPKYHLLTLDASGEKDVRAAIATGDVDKAANVATMVPGVSTTVRNDMDSMLGNAEKLRTHAGADSTAAVAWLGYDAPPAAPILGDTSDQNGSVGDIITTGRADEGARSLNGFHEGIQAYRQSQGTDPHLTTVDHSYGSLTAGTAALSTKTGVVDDMVLYGSPGGRADDVHEYNVPEGHVYASANKGDFVAGLGPDSSFGHNPVKLPGVKNISSDERGHSDYWDNPEFVEDVSQITAGENPETNRPDNQAAAAGAKKTAAE